MRGNGAALPVLRNRDFKPQSPVCRPVPAVGKRRGELSPATVGATAGSTGSRRSAFRFLFLGVNNSYFWFRR